MLLASNSQSNQQGELQGLCHRRASRKQRVPLGQGRQYRAITLRNLVLEGLLRKERQSLCSKTLNTQQTKVQPDSKSHANKDCRVLGRPYPNHCHRLDSGLTETDRHYLQSHR